MVIKKPSKNFSNQKEKQSRIQVPQNSKFLNAPTPFSGVPRKHLLGLKVETQLIGAVEPFF